MQPDTTVKAEPDLLFPRYATIRARDEQGLDFDVDLNVFYDPSSWRYTVESATLMKRPRHLPIDTTSLRDLKVTDLLRRGLSDLAWIETPEGERIPAVLSTEDASRIRSQGPSSDESLRWVARLYTRAWALHAPPAQEVQEQLGLSRPNTSVWLRRARDRGFLTEPSDRNYGSSSLGEEALADARRYFGRED